LSIKVKIKTSAYYDSVTLMVAARELLKFPGVEDASIVMGTQTNKDILKQNNLYSAEIDPATPNDLILAVRMAGNADAALAEAEQLLNKKTASSEGTNTYKPKTVRSALKMQPGSNLAIISVAGRYAAGEAWEALHQGLHVLLFSDNVSLEDEIALKKYAAQNGLLLMGPGAGTAILNGVGLGFANALPKGPVGIVSAAGTGLQEVSTLLAKHGVGITQGIGTGGRDLKKEVGGIMMLQGLMALQADADTKVIVLISKPPAEEVARKLLDQARLSKKPTVICFLGQSLPMGKGEKIYSTTTLEEAALQAARLAGADLPTEAETFNKQHKEISQKAEQLRTCLKPGQKYLRGLFSGGTLCYEAQVIWSELVKKPVLSNAPLEKAQQMADSNKSQGHCAIDLGEEEFTVGRPHPMIDNDLRIRRILQEAQDAEVAVILLDVVIGYGAHPDPASELAAAARQAIQLAARDKRQLIFVASVTGTEQDPQCLSKTTKTLEEAGIIVCESNAMAAQLTAAILTLDYWTRE
jgi:FdrA protein